MTDGKCQSNSTTIPLDIRLSLLHPFFLLRYDTFPQISLIPSLTIKPSVFTPFSILLGPFCFPNSINLYRKMGWIGTVEVNRDAGLQPGKTFSLYVSPGSGPVS